MAAPATSRPPRRRRTRWLTALAKSPKRHPIVFYSSVVTAVSLALALLLWWTLLDQFSLCWFLGANLAAFGLFVYDKLQAHWKGWRVPEWGLLWSVLIFGEFGALIGVLLVRHKTQKQWFILRFVAIVLLHIVVLAWWWWRRG